MVTISDIHGTRQYTLHQLIRKLALWVIAAVVVIIAGGALFIHLLSGKVADLDRKTQEYGKIQQMLLQQNARLLHTKKALEAKISGKSEELQLMNEQLSQIEKIIGLKPDISDAFDKRIEEARRRSLANLKEAKLTVAQLSLLNRSVPTGAPLHGRYRITDGFGYRIHPITHQKRFHFGVDLATQVGTPVYAPADGVVEYAKHKSGYGNYMLINHPFGFKTGYGHLSRFAKREGDIVKKGDLIAYSGNTGRSTGPHLHYEVRYLYKWLDPMHFVRWSSKNYRTIMQQESLVQWRALLELIQNRYDLAKEANRS